MIEPIKNYDRIIYSSAETIQDELQLNPMPSNMILNKVVTGWGATYGEIKSDRNSIILLPHKSQIYSKHNFHKSIDYTMPVTEQQKVSDLIKHIKGSRGKRIKFLSTPEGLWKVIKAVREAGGNPFTDYFILCDECHKLTKDSGYRVNISIAMQDFFDFKHKAMISATPFKPSHPRFKSFEFVKVQHERPVRKDIYLKYVNNTGAAFKEYLNSYTGELLFVFYNTLNGIDALIKLGGLESQANIYCSEDGVKDLKLKGYENVDSKIDTQKIAKYNFLTSSFFNGLDIQGLSFIPDVLIITDIHYADHTIIDPNTDTYQILGRFRHPHRSGEIGDRINTATHIINIKHNTFVKLEEQAVNDFQLSKRRYEHMLEIQATVTDDYLRDDIFGEALTRIKPYANLLDINGDLDYFKYDNYLYDYRLKMCYGDEIAPGLTYLMSDLYNITEERKIYLPEELESMSKDMRRYSKDGIRWACEQIILHENQDSLGATETYTEICKRFPLVVRAVEILGYDQIQALQYSKTSIERELLKHDICNGKIHQGMIEAVYMQFKCGVSYPISEVKEKLQALFIEFNVNATAKSTDIRTYFNVREFNGYKKLLKRDIKQLDGSAQAIDNIIDVNGTKSRSVRMCKILERKHNLINLNTTRSAQ